MITKLLKLSFVLFFIIASLIALIEYLYRNTNQKPAVEASTVSLWHALYAKPEFKNNLPSDELIAIDQLAWPEELIAQLKQNSYVILDDSNGDASLFHGYLPDSQQVWLAEIENTTTNQISSGWWLLSYGLLALILMVWSYPLIRDIYRLKLATDFFGKNRQIKPTGIKPSSIIYPIEQSFNETGKKVLRLMSLQKDIASFAYHDIRTPLTRIRFACEFLGKAEQENKENIIEEIGEIESLIKELIRYSELEHTQPLLNQEPIQLKTLLNDIIAKYQTTASVSVSLVMENDVNLNAERELLKRLIENLINNCLRFANQQIVITVSQHDPLVIQIEDDGPGFSQAELENAKQAYFTSDPEESNTHSGLGLAISESICRWHGWQFKIQNSSKYRGALFIINI